MRLVKKFLLGRSTLQFRSLQNKQKQHKKGQIQNEEVSKNEQAYMTINSFPTVSMFSVRINLLQSCRTCRRLQDISQRRICCKIFDCIGLCDFHIILRQLFCNIFWNIIFKNINPRRELNCMNLLACRHRRTRFEAKSEQRNKEMQ